MKGPEAATKLPQVTPHTRCRLKLLKMERIKDYLLMEEEFIRNQERLKPQEERNEEERCVMLLASHLSFHILKSNLNWFEDPKSTTCVVHLCQ